MARGTSGRIVVELDPDLKAALYAALAHDRLTLHDWVIRQASAYVESSRQPSLFRAQVSPQRKAEDASDNR